MYDEVGPIKASIYEIRNTNLGPSHRDTLQARHNCAGTFFNQGNFEEAYNIWKEVYDQQILTFGTTDDPEICRTQNNMAETKVMLEEYDEAIEIYSEVLGKRERTLLSGHPDTLTTRYGIAKILVKQEKLDDALNIFQEVLEKREKYLRYHHKDTLATIDDIADILVKQNRLGEAIQSINEVYQRRNASLGSGHPDTIKTQKAIDEIKIRLTVPEMSK